MPKKNGLEQFADLEGAWKKRGWGVFEGMVDTAIHTMVFANIIRISKITDRHLKCQLHALAIKTITYLFLPFYFCTFPRFCH